MLVHTPSHEMIKRLGTSYLRGLKRYGLYGCDKVQLSASVAGEVAPVGFAHSMVLQGASESWVSSVGSITTSMSFCPEGGHDKVAMVMLLLTLKSFNIIFKHKLAWDLKSKGD